MERESGILVLDPLHLGAATPFPPGSFCKALVTECPLPLWWAGHFTGVLLTLCFRADKKGKMKNPQKPLPWSLGEIYDILLALRHQHSAVWQGLHVGGLVEEGNRETFEIRSLDVIKSLLSPGPVKPSLASLTAHRQPSAYIPSVTGSSLTVS